MTRKQRIALELLGPPLLGGALATLWAWGALMYNSLYRYESIWEAVSQQGMPPMWLFYVVFAFPMIGLQAAGYSAIMEWRFARGLNPHSWQTVTLSTVLGWLSGLPLAFGYGYERKETWYLFNIIGPVVGLALGLLIRRWSSPSPVTDPSAR